MSLEYSSKVEQHLDEFLAHPTKRVLLFKGKWGVGKTYYWTKNYLPSRLRKEGRINERLYAYVSLFGVENVADVEQLILSSSVKTGDKNAIHIIETGIRKSTSLLKLIPALKDYQDLANRIGHMVIRNTLICIDEIERKATGLSLASIMGLISVLREHNGCRFVLIMNDEHISGEDVKDFKTYREKVIDETITYVPDIADNTRLIFSNNSILSLCIEVFQRLEVNNIRVMQQTAWAIEHFLPHTKSLEPSVAQQFQEHIILLTAFFHIPALGIDVNKLPRESIMDYYFRKDKEKDPEHKREMETARRYGYNIQEYDHIIVDYMNHGSCDEKNLRSFLQEANLREQQGQFKTKFDEMWTPYNQSFKANTIEVCNSFKTFLDEYAGYLSFSQLWEILRLTDSLGMRPKRKKWLDSWIAPRIDSSSLKDLYELDKHCNSKKLKEAIRKRQKRLGQEISIAKLMMNVVDGNGWSQEIVRQLSSYGEDEFRRELQRYDEKDFLSGLRRFCELWRRSGPDEQAVQKKIENALLSIARHSGLNSLRVRKIIPWAFPQKESDTFEFKTLENTTEEKE